VERARATRPARVERVRAEPEDQALGQGGVLEVAAEPEAVPEQRVGKMHRPLFRLRMPVLSATPRRCPMQLREEGARPPSCSRTATHAPPAIRSSSTRWCAAAHRRDVASTISGVPKERKRYAHLRLDWDARPQSRAVKDLTSSGTRASVTKDASEQPIAELET